MIKNIKPMKPLLNNKNIQFNIIKGKTECNEEEGHEIRWSASQKNSMTFSSAWYCSVQWTMFGLMRGIRCRLDNLSNVMQVSDGYMVTIWTHPVPWHERPAKMVLSLQDRKNVRHPNWNEIQQGITHGQHLKLWIWEFSWVFWKFKIKELRWNCVEKHMRRK